MIKRLNYINLHEENFTNPSSLILNKKYVVTGHQSLETSEYFAYLEDTIQNIHEYEIQSFNLSASLDKYDVPLRIYNMIQQIYPSYRYFDSLIINLDSIMRLYLSPKTSPRHHSLLNDQWDSFLKRIPTDVRNRSFFIIGNTIYPMKSFHFIVRAIARHYNGLSWDGANKPMNDFDFKVNKPTRKYIKTFMKLYEEKQLLELVESPYTSLEPELFSSKSRFALYINDSNQYFSCLLPDQLLPLLNPENSHSSKLRSLTNFLYGYKIQNSTTGFIDHSNYSKEDIDVDEILLSFIDNEMGVVLEDQPKLLKLLAEIRFNEFDELFIYDMNDISKNPEIQRKFLKYAESYNLTVRSFSNGIEI